MNTKENILQAYGTTWAGNGSDQLPMPVQFIHPGKNYMLSATGILNPSTSLEMSVGRASNSLNYQLQNPNLFRSAAGLTGLPLLFPDAVQADYIPYFEFRGGRTANAGQYQTDRGPFTNENKTTDVLANLSKIWGSHSTKFGISYQHSFKPQSIFAAFNSDIQFQDDANNPFDTGYGYANAATGVFRNYIQASKYALPEWNYKNTEWYGQDNWKASKKLTLDYGVRFYYWTPQWDTTLQASTFLPDKFDPAQAAKLFRPVCIGAYPCSGDNRRGMDPTLVNAGVAPTPANTVSDRFVGRLVPGSNRFNGAFQAGEGVTDTLQDGNKLRVSPRLGFTYDVSGNQSMIVRGGVGIFYDRPQGNQVFDMIANAPGVLVSNVQWGRLQDLGSGSTGTDPFPTLSLSPSGFNFVPPKTYQWNVGVQRKLWDTLILDVAYVGSKSTDLLRQSQINSVPAGAKFLPQNQDPTRAPSSVPGATALPDDLLRPYQGYNTIRMWDYTGWGNYNALQGGITKRFDKGFMVSAFYVWSKALTVNNDDFTRRAPQREQGRDQAARLLVRAATTGRTTSCSTSSTRCPSSPAAPSVRSRTTGRSPASTAGRAACPTASPTRSPASATQPERHRQPRRARGGHVRPRQGLQQRPVPADRAPRVLRPAAAGQRRRRVRALLPAQPSDQQPRPVDREEVPGQEGRPGGTARRVQRAQPHAVPRDRGRVSTRRPRSTSRA